MLKINDILKNKETLEQDLQNNFYAAMKDEKFKKIRNIIKLEDKKLYKCTGKLLDSSIEFDNCLNCKGLEYCKNEVSGYVYLPTVNNNNIIFSYNACKYKNKELEQNQYKKNIDLFDVPSTLKNAKMKDIYTDDKSRFEIIKYISNFYKQYFDKKEKGLYLYGNFGCGKTYLIAALFNELAKEGIKSSIIYFPEFLRTLKESFSGETSNTYSQKYEYIKKVPLLLIDDVGAENVTAWGRDEILGTLLQYRMDENLPTFFTSNLSLEELENHLSLASKSVDKVKARRIIERIKYLSNDMKLIGLDRRNK